MHTQQQRPAWRLPASLGALSLALLLAAPAAAVTLRVAAQEGTEPKFIAAGPEQGAAVVGLCVDILRAIEHITPGLTFVGDQHWMPLVRVYTQLGNGEQDAACGVQRTHARESRYRYLEPALFTLNYMLLARADDAIEVNNWNDLRQLGPRSVVLANRGFAAVEMLGALGGVQVDSSSASPAMNLQKLIAGRGRLFLHRTPGLQAFLNQNGAAGKVRILPVPMISAKVYLALGRHVKPEVVAQVQRALTRLDQTGELHRLLQRWDDAAPP